MTNAAFLLAAVGFSVVVSVVIWAASRKPRTFMSSISDFEREMRALGGEADLVRKSPDIGPRIRPREDDQADQANQANQVDHGNQADQADGELEPTVIPEEPRP